MGPGGPGFGQKGSPRRLHRDVGVRVQRVDVLRGLVETRLPNRGRHAGREAGVGQRVLELAGKAVTHLSGLGLGLDHAAVSGRGPNVEVERRRQLGVGRVRLDHAPSERRESANNVSALTFDGWTLDLAAWELTDPAGRPVELTSHEFELLAALAAHAGRVLSRDAILEIVAGRDWTPYDRSVDVLVGKLRRKLGDDPRAPRMIKTVRGAGYKLTSRVDPR